jgi:hypothetical protein
MSDFSAVLDTLELACKALKQNEETFRWEWEERFDAALSVYQAEDSAKVRGLLEEHFKARWDAATLSDAPANVQQFVKSLGGLRGNQELFTSDPSLDLVVAVALWPWGGGAKISIRLWFLSKNVSDDEKEDLQNRFRSWFR